MPAENSISIFPGGILKGELRPPGDKSISHRALIFGAFARGKTIIEGLLNAADCLTTIECLKKLGVLINPEKDGTIVIEGRDKNFQEPQQVLDAGNSGTTARLLLGVLAGVPGFSVLTGDSSLSRRPMLRVVSPLRLMGAKIDGRRQGDLLPLAVTGSVLHPISYKLPVASAQLKSALLLAGLYVPGWTEICEPGPGRDHTERMMRYMGVGIETISGGRIAVNGEKSLRGSCIRIPADFSSAAFFIVAALLLPGSNVVFRDVGVNPRRTGLLEVLSEMGGHIEKINPRDWNGEPVADLIVKGGDRLRSVSIGGEIIPRLIDEIPVLAVAAAAAQGRTEIRDAAELKVKESNRLSAIVREMIKMGADVKELPDGLVVNGSSQLQGADINTYGDHRIAMAMTVASLIALGQSRLSDVQAVAISYPFFFEDLNTIRCNVD